MTNRRRLRIGLYPGAELLTERPSAQALEKIKIADRLGYDSLWVDDSSGFDVVTVLGEAVRATEQMEIGTAIMNVFSRSPTVIAETFATLDVLSSGRMVIGLGASVADWIEPLHGVPFVKPLRRLREYIEIINLLMRGERLAYHGDLLNLELGYRFSFAPVRDHIPIYIGATGPKSIEQTGEIADGILTTEDLPKDLYGAFHERLAAGAARAGRNANEITVAATISVAYVIDESQRESQRRQFVQQRKPRIARSIAGLWATEEYKERLARDFPEEVKAVEAAWVNDREAAVAAITDEMVEAETIVGVGTPQEIHEALIELRALGADLPILPMPPGNPDDPGRILEELIKD